MTVLPVLFDSAAESDGKYAVGARLKPHFPSGQPDVRQLDLKTVHYLLLEKPVLIQDGKAVRRVFKRGKRIHKAGGKPAKTSVAQPRVRLAVVKALKLQPHLFKRL